jgi:hypothetical protein
MGISRSATVVCAYLVATAKMTSDEALVAVQAKRGIVCPNIGFRSQLEQYADQLHGGRSTRPAKLEAIRKLIGKAQKGSNTRRSSSTSTLPISDVTAAAS